MSANPWLKIRLLLLCLAALFGALAGFLPLAAPFSRITEMPTVMKFLVAFFALSGLVATPFIIAAVILLQSINPLSDKKWQRPTHSLNPFWLGNPLPFFHFASFALFAIALGMLLTSFAGGTARFVCALFVFASGLAALAGVHLAMRMAKSKLPEPDWVQSPSSTFESAPKTVAENVGEMHSHGSAENERTGRRGFPGLTPAGAVTQFVGLNRRSLYSFLRIIQFAPLLFLILGAIIGYFRWRTVQRSTVVEATIVDFASKELTDGTMYVPVYSFVDGAGETMRAQSLNYSNSPRGTVGDTAEVLYDPTDPDAVIRNNAFNIWIVPGAFIVTGLVTFVALTIVVRVFSGRA